jgi:RNA polymerase sigma factor (sigma-70 family)
MPKAPFSDVLQYLRKVCGAHAARDLSDRQLLKRFIHEHEDVAFTVLVQRHGPMVLSVCQRALGNVHDAEDCLQATFMVLVRRAPSLRLKASLATWLYAVAQRVASKARAQILARRKRERQVEPMPQRELLDELTWQDLRGVLDAEIAKLPEKYEAPLVLCYLEGKSQEQAARELGWPKNTLTKRMGRARELLRQRLVRRGVALSAAVLATVLCEKVSGAEVGAMLVIRTVKAAAGVAAGKAMAGGCLSVQAIALTEEVVTGLVGVKAKALVMVLAVGLAVGGAGLAGYGGFGEKEEPAQELVEAQTPSTKQDIEGKDKKAPPVLTDVYGDPLPEGAKSRLGTIRFRHDGFETGDVVFSPDGKVLASAGGYGFGVCLWDANTGKPLHRLSVPNACGSHSLAFAPDGKTLLAAGILSTAGGEKSLHFLDVTTGNELRRLEVARGEGQPSALFSAAFSPDGKMVAAGTYGKEGAKVVLWDVQTSKELRRMEWKYEGITKSLYSPRIAFSPNSKVLAAGSFDSVVRVWDAATGKELRRLEGHEKRVWSVDFAPDGKVLASSGEDGFVCLWDWESGKLAQRLKTNDTLNPAVAFAPNGKLLASGSPSGFCLWDLATGKELRRWPTPLTSMSFSPDGKVLATVHGTPDGKVLATDRSHALRRWDVATGLELGSVANHTSKINSVHFAADGKTLFSMGWDRKVFQWNLATARAENELFDGAIWTLKNLSSVEAAELSPDGKIGALAIWLGADQGKGDPFVHLVDAKTGKELHALGGHIAVPSLKFSPNAKLLVTSDRVALRLWDVADGKELSRLTGGHFPPGPLAFSSDSRLLAYLGLDGTIRLWDVAEGKEVRRWDSGQRRKGQDIVALAFSPDGRFIASNVLNVENGVTSGGFLIWNCATGKEVLHFAAKPKWPRIIFSASARTVMVAASDFRKGTGEGLEFVSDIRVLEVLSGQEIQQFNTPQQMVECLALSPDGRTLASCGSDTTILLWDLTGQATNAKPAPLTQAQLERLWSDLADDAPQADRAIWSLAQAPAQGLTFLKVQLRPRPAAPADQVAKLIADLDSEGFAVRQKAAQTLDALGEAAELALRKTLEGNVTLETRQRVEQILQNRRKDVLRQLRAIDALEQIGTTEAREVLLALANGTPNPRVADAASAALRRLAQRPLGE